MKKRKNYFAALFVFLGAIYFFSCSKKEDTTDTVNGPCSDFTSPYVTNDGPLQMGSTLHLTASSDEQNITYQWTGPKNFSSGDKNPVINNIAFDAGGTYYARIINQECTSNTSPTYVIVNAPCSIADNSGVFGNATWDFNSSITCGIHAYGYVILGSSINGELKIKFATDNAPTVNKILKVDDPGTAAFDSTEVQLSITNSAGTTFTGQSGNAYVSNYGNLTVAFCSVTFKSSTGIILTGGAKINCQ